MASELKVLSTAWASDHSGTDYELSSSTTLPEQSQADYELFSSALPTNLTATFFLPSNASPRPSEIATQKRKAKKKVQTRQVSSGTEVGTPDIADDIAVSKLPQRSSKKKALERKVWNDTTSNNHKCAPTVTELPSAPATKSVRKIQKTVKGGGCERSSVASTLMSRNGVSVDTNDSASEYGISDSEANKSDVEVEDNSDISDLLSQTPENLQKVLMKEIPSFVPPHLASHYSDSSAAASTGATSGDDQLVMVTADSVKVKYGSINLKAQNTRIQMVLKTAVFEFKKSAIFENAFPTITEK
ncbi:hypothetical protein BDR03DRAFT_1019205 [Suillus americanus]|nr:hypothetical protein BDR03DRAFT_1019205 [Suillus americanus]